MDQRTGEVQYHRLVVRRLHNFLSSATAQIAHLTRQSRHFKKFDAALYAEFVERNHLTVRRDEVEARVLNAPQEKLLNQELFAEFCDEFTREMNRPRMERRAGLSSAKRDVERISTRIKKLLNLMLDDEIAVDEGKAEMKSLDDRRKELQAQLENADEPPPLLHPDVAELYRQKVTTLAQALEHPETRTEASEALRGLIDAIVMTPAEGRREST